MADGNKEEWCHTVERVVAGNIALVPHSLAPDEDEVNELTQLILDMRVLPAGRHLWASGADTQLGLYNCHRAGWDVTLSGHSTFTFNELMLGGGVGTNYSQNYLDEGPRVSQVVSFLAVMDTVHPDFSECDATARFDHGEKVVYQVRDSREGWVFALKMLIDAHVHGPTALCMDFSRVRERGAAILGFGGTASGPGPLIEMLHTVNEMLNAIVGDKLDPITAMEIDHGIAACVVAGNVRRSARMSILHWDDAFIFDFIGCKSDPSAHWSTNISVEIDDSFFTALQAGEEHAALVLKAVSAGMLANGEPGFYNSSLASVGETGDVRAPNPCGEIALEAWEQCCLGHVNLAAFVDDTAGLMRAFELITRYLIRATFAKSSDPRQEAVKSRNRRIGVGFFGFHDWAALHKVKYSDIVEDETLRLTLAAAKDRVSAAAAEYATELGIPVPIKTTTVAPTGSIAKLPGVSEGIQPPYARYFIRRVRYANTDAKLAGLIAAGYETEPCIYTANTTVVSFPCREGIVDSVPDDMVQQSDEVSVSDYLEVQSFVQRTWADNAVSITANIKREHHTADSLAGLLHTWLPFVKGTTVMPEDGRPQSPYERITEEQYYASELRSVGQAMDDCATGACPIR